MVSLGCFCLWLGPVSWFGWTGKVTSQRFDVVQCFDRTCVYFLVRSRACCLSLVAPPPLPYVFSLGDGVVDDADTGVIGDTNGWSATFTHMCPGQRCGRGRVGVVVVNVFHQGNSPKGEA